MWTGSAQYDFKCTNKLCPLIWELQQQNRMLRVPGNYRGAFAGERGLIICSYYIENESGTRLERRNFFRLLRDCNKMNFVYRGCGQTFPPVRGRRNTLKKMIRQKDIRVMAVNVRRHGLILVWVSLIAGCLQPLTICWICWPLLPEGLWTTAGTPETKG